MIISQEHNYKQHFDFKINICKIGMAHQVKALMAEPNGLSLTLETSWLE